jgi:hypothetical protein
MALPTISPLWARRPALRGLRRKFDICGAVHGLPVSVHAPASFHILQISASDLRAKTAL